MEKPTIRIFSSVEELLNAIATHIVKLGNSAIEEKGHFNLVLSGGSSPQQLYGLLTSTSFSSLLDWTKVYFFFGDERYVPMDSFDNNAFMASKLLFEPLKISSTQVFRVHTDLPVEEAARQYAEQIQRHFNGKPAVFDCVLLGLGDNAHTASLFPFTSILAETIPTVKSVFVPELNRFRISFTAPLINQAIAVLFLVYGRSKAQAVQETFGKQYNPGKYPAQLIKPELGELFWYLDEEAAL